MASSTQFLENQLELLQVSTPTPFASCWPDSNPLDFFRIHIAKSVAEFLKIDAANVLPVLQRPSVLSQGDLILAVPALKIKGEKPDILASRLAEQFPRSPLLERIAVSGIHMSFFFNPALLNQLVLPSILKNQTTWGGNSRLGLRDPNDPNSGRKRVVIEYSSPNIAKPFHQGHLRSTIIGGFLANIHRLSGWDVVSLNYLGDWGKQYGLLALAFEMFGDEKELERDPIQHLFQLYVKVNRQVTEQQEAIEKAEAAGEDTSELRKNSLDEKARQYFKAMCDKDPKAIALWSKFRQLSIERYMSVYARLNIQFDQYAGESQVQEDSMRAAEKKVSDLKLSSISDGATIVDFSKHIPGKLGKQLGKALLRKRDNTSLYLTRDLGAIFERQEQFHFDRMIYVVAHSQELHLKQLFKLVELMDADLASKLTHVDFGLVRGMSTRKGTVVFLDDVLRDVGEKMHEVMKKNEEKYAQVIDPTKTADILGISSVMVQDLSGKRINGYDFDIDAMTSFEGDTGPYLQYSHARLCSIIKKAGVSENINANLSLLTEPHATNLVRCLAQFPDIIRFTMTTLEPTNILTYLFRLTHLLNSSYDILRVVGSPEEVMKARLQLFRSTRAVLNHGMRLLGLTPLDRM